MVSASAIRSAAVTPSDSTALSFRALWIGTTGNVAIKHNPSDSAVTYSNVPVGILPVSGGIVMSTNTTASNIVAMDW